jgi:hypothetical protein
MTDEVRDMIARALDGEPPVGIDYATVAAAGRRRIARRNLGIAGAAVLGVVAVVSVAVTVGQLAAQPGGNRVGSPSTSRTAPTGAIPTGTVPTDGCVVAATQGGYSAMPDGVASPAELAESARLTAAFARFAVPLPAGVTMVPVSPRLCAIQNSWGTDFTLRSVAGDRAVFIEVLPRSGQPAGTCARSSSHVRCTPRPLPGGGLALVDVEQPVQPTDPMIIGVKVWRTDDTVVRVMETGAQNAPPTPRMLSDDALIAIAMAPQLRVTWSGPARLADPSDRHAGELTSALAKSFALPPGMQAKPVPHALAGALTFYVSQGGYKLDADLVDPAGTGNLFINLNPPAGQSMVECRGAPNCHLITLPDGRKATLSQPAGDGATTIMLETVAADGTEVSVMTRNQAQGRSGATRPQPPLRVDDLIRIASVSELSW